MPDGSPQVMPVWGSDYAAGGHIRVNTARGRAKARDMARDMADDARVALAVMAPDNAYRYRQIRGRIARASEQGADADIDSLAKKYLDKDKYPFRRPDELGVIFEVEPPAVCGIGWVAGQPSQRKESLR